MTINTRFSEDDTAFIMHNNLITAARVVTVHTATVQGKTEITYKLLNVRGDIKEDELAASAEELCERLTKTQDNR